jgi:hypothetical protein
VKFKKNFSNFSYMEFCIADVTKGKNSGYPRDRHGPRCLVLCIGPLKYYALVTKAVHWWLGGRLPAAVRTDG